MNQFLKSPLVDYSNWTLRQLAENLKQLDQITMGEFKVLDRLFPSTMEAGAREPALKIKDIQFILTCAQKYYPQMRGIDPTSFPSILNRDNIAP